MFALPVPHLQASSSAKADDPVRRSSCDLVVTSLEYWIARLLFSPET
jgi:hypothetical protein